MSENKSNVTYGGPGLASLLTVLFVGLKLTGHITWEWWWVLSPLWISAGIGISFLLVALIVAILIGVFK